MRSNLPHRMEILRLSYAKLTIKFFFRKKLKVLASFIEIVGRFTYHVFFLFFWLLLLLCWVGEQEGGLLAKVGGRTTTTAGSRSFIFSLRAAPVEDEPVICLRSAD